MGDFELMGNVAPAILGEVPELVSPDDDRKNKVVC